MTHVHVVLTSHLAIHHARIYAHGCTAADSSAPKLTDLEGVAGLRPHSDGVRRALPPPPSFGVSLAR